MSLLVIVTLALAVVLSAEANGAQPSITVTDQPIVSNNVTIEKVVTEAYGWLMVHANSSGALGKNLGHTWVDNGTSSHIIVELLKNGRTNTLFAVLYLDANQTGVFEPANDTPVMVDDEVLARAFQRTETLEHPLLNAFDQSLVDDLLTLDLVVSDGPGWLLVHADNGSGPPETLLGQTWVGHGTNRYVMVKLASGGRTGLLHLSLHTDRGQMGLFEFPGVDHPVRIDGDPLGTTLQVHDLISLVSSISVGDQSLVNELVTIDEATSAGPGWVVVYADDNGSPGPVLGQTGLSHGTTQYVNVVLDQDLLSLLLHVRLHQDRDGYGTFEFPGNDSLVMVDEQVIGTTFGISSIISQVPAIVALNQTIVADTITLDRVISSGPGWVVVFARTEGRGSEIRLGQTWVPHGISEYVMVQLDTPNATIQLPIQLHKDVGSFNELDYPGVDKVVTLEGENLATSIWVPELSSSDPAILVRHQPIVSDLITIDEVRGSGPGWVLAYADDGSGGNGVLLGSTWVTFGTSELIEIELASAGRTASLHLQLHGDAGQYNTFEFPGPDTPVLVENESLMTTINLDSITSMAPLVTVVDQPIVAHIVSIDQVVSAGPGWLVIRSDDGGTPAARLGQTWLEHGINHYVEVELMLDGRTSLLYATLHTDSEALRIFDPADGDTEVSVDGQPLTPSFTVDRLTSFNISIVVASQSIVDDKINIDEIISPGPGWVVIHADNGFGAPGSVIGKAWVAHGFNPDVMVELGLSGRTRTEYALLYSDGGIPGLFDSQYDKPVEVEGLVVTRSFNLKNVPNSSGLLEDDDVASGEDGGFIVGFTTMSAFGVLTLLSLLVRSRPS